MNSSSGPPRRGNWRAPRTPRQQQREPNPRPGYSQSRLWRSPTYRQGGGVFSILQLNEVRRKVCPKSPFWYQDFNLKEHQKDWAAGEQRRQQHLKSSKDVEEQLRQDLKRIYGCDWIRPLRPISAPFNNRSFIGKEGGTGTADYGVVIFEQTIFSPNWMARGGKDISPWPLDHELKYEGEGRLATDKLHRRFLPMPRVDGPMNWQQRAQIDQYNLDDFYAYVPRTKYDTNHRPEYRREVDWELVFLRMHHIAEREFSDDTTWNDEESWKRALGSDLVDLLDPQDQWT